MNQLATVREGDSYWSVAERLLGINARTVSRSDLGTVVQTLMCVNDARLLEPGKNLLATVLGARKANSVLRSELDVYARKILEDECTLQSRRWTQPIDSTEQSLRDSWISAVSNTGVAV
ncbi:MAG: hypothetical protein ACRD3W_26645 [Terriglobales bacterium]